MCLLVLSWRAHTRYRLVIAANRDEYHARAAAPLASWQDLPEVAGGRDLQAMGAWFAVDQRRRCGIVTNFREFGRRRRNAPTRGGLIPAFLSSERSAGEFLESLEVDAPAYAGFNLLLADHDSLWYASNRADRFARELPAGIYGLSNDFIDTPWPKVVRIRERFQSLLADVDSHDPRKLAGALLAALDDREPAPPETLLNSQLDAEWARKLSAPFVLDASYGTRCSTVLLLADDGELLMRERRFDAHGDPAGESEYALNAAGT